MREIQRAQKELDQSHIDFYRPVCYKEVLDEIQMEMKNSSFKQKAKN